MLVLVLHVLIFSALRKHVDVWAGIISKDVYELGNVYMRWCVTICKVLLHCSKAKVSSEVEKLGGSIELEHSSLKAHVRVKKII